MQSSPLSVPKSSIVPNAQFAEQFNQSHFSFEHQLANHPLFEIPRLMQLAQTLSQSDRGGVLCQSGHAQIQQRWTDLPLKSQILESLADIEGSASRVLLQGAQIDPDYQALLDQILDELEQLTAVPLRQQISWVDAYIFISSPNAITPYHIDHESNFLFQIRGNKEVYLFDQTDRSVLTEAEIEGYYVGDFAAATYRSEHQAKATLYSLQPGQGVHHPINAPHWVKTNDSVAITLSVLFFMKPYDLKARIYQTNYYLRKLGLAPTPPGHSAWKDSLKIFSLGLLSKRSHTTKSEVVRSGINRLKSPFKKLKRS